MSDTRHATHLPAPRRDKRGRRIGRNAWRDHVVEAWTYADHAWWLDREAVAIGYPTEEAEYAQAHPRPRLGDFMVALSPGWCRPASSRAA